MARPTELTPELQARFIELLRAYPCPESIAIECGIGKSTYYRWRQLGRKGIDPYREFLELCDATRIEKFRALSKMVENAVLDDPKNWKGAVELLKRFDPKRWREAPPAGRPTRTPAPDLRDADFWQRFESETRERLAIQEERKRLLGESAQQMNGSSHPGLPEVIDAAGEEQH